MSRLGTGLRIGLIVSALGCGYAGTGCASAIQHDWQIARQADTIEQYRAFIGEHPASPLAELAEQRVGALQHASDWKKAREVASIASYESFMLAHPLSRHAEEAIEELHRLYAQRAANELEDAWARAKLTDTVAGYERFLIEHPGSPFIGEARRRMENQAPDMRTRAIRDSLRQERDERVAAGLSAVIVFGVFSTTDTTGLIYKNEERRFLKATADGVVTLPEDFELLCLRFAEPYEGIAILLSERDLAGRDWYGGGDDRQDRSWLNNQIEGAVLNFHREWSNRPDQGNRMGALWVGLPPHVFPSAEDGTFSSEHRRSESPWASSLLSAHRRPLGPESVLQVSEPREAPFPAQLLARLEQELTRPPSIQSDGDGTLTSTYIAMLFEREGLVAPDDESPRTRAAKVLLWIGTGAAEAALVRGGETAVAAIIDAVPEVADDRLRMAIRALLEIGPAGRRALGEHLEAVDSGARSEVLATLEQRGDAAAIETVAPLLENWWLGGEVAGTLRRMGWEPSTPREAVHLAVARRDRSWLVEHWQAARKVLLEDVGSGDEDRIRLGVYSLVASGQEEVVDDLVLALDPGSAVIAHSFLNSGHPTLEDAGRRWATERGLGIITLPGGAAVSWGHFHQP